MKFYKYMLLITVALAQCTNLICMENNQMVENSEPGNMFLNGVGMVAGYAGLCYIGFKLGRLAVNVIDRTSAYINPKPPSLAQKRFEIQSNFGMQFNITTCTLEEVEKELKRVDDQINLGKNLIKKNSEYITELTKYAGTLEEKAAQLSLM